MIERLKIILQQDCNLVPTKLSILGVSGGADSLLLLDLFDRLRFSFAVAHYHHGLRPEADSEAHFVKELAESRRVPFLYGSGDVQAYAESSSISIEEAARELRYQFLFSQAEKKDAQAVVVGHTANDQVETVLMHILRGSGLAGLKGMLLVTLPTAWSREIPLVRPLLPVWRDEIIGYLADRGLKPVLDTTNLDTKYFRNRVRHELIPYLQSFNPAIEKNLLQMAQILGGDFELITELVDQTWDRCVDEIDRSFVAFRTSRLSELPSGLQRHLIRRGMAWLRPGLRDMDFDTVERSVNFIDTPSQSGELSLAGGISICHENDRIYLFDDEQGIAIDRWPQLPADAPLELSVPGTARLAGDWMIHALFLGEDIGSVRRFAQENSDPYQAWIDAEKISLPIIIRSRLPGDRFKPLGMNGRSQKISDLMVNKKVPARARAKWPLFTSGEEVIWVPGVQVGHLVRLTSDTKQVVLLKCAHGR